MVVVSTTAQFPASSIQCYDSEIQGPLGVYILTPSSRYSYLRKHLNCYWRITATIY